MMQQSPSQQEAQVFQQLAQALQQGASPEELVGQLVQMGLPQDQAIQIIQSIMQQMQGANMSSMMHGGSIRKLRRAALGMEFESPTIPNIESYPSYDTYKAAYNEFLTSINTTTTFDPNAIDWNQLAYPEKYEDPAIDTFQRRINSSLIGPTDTTDKITPDPSNQLVPVLRPNPDLQKGIEEEIKQKTEEPSDWQGKTLAALVGLGAIKYLGVPAAKYLNRYRQKRFGTTPEIDQSNLSKKDKDVNERKVSAYKLLMDERGYTVGKRDVNELVSRGMSRADAQAWVDQMPTKQEYKERQKKSSRPQPDVVETESPAEKPVEIVDDYLDKIKNANKVEELVSKDDYDYHRTGLEEAREKNDEFFIKYHSEYLSATPKEFLEKQLKNISELLKNVEGTNIEKEKEYRKYLDILEAKLKRLNEIAPDGGVAPNFDTKTSEVTSPKAEQKKVVAQPLSMEENLIVSMEENLRRARAHSQLQTTMSKTKERLQYIKDLRNSGKSKTEIQRLLKAANMLAPGEKFIESRGIRPNPDTDLSNYTGKRAIKEAKKQIKEKAMKEGKGKFKLAMGGYVPEYAAQAYGAYDLPEFEMGSYYEDGGGYTGTWNGNQGFAEGGMYYNPFEEPTGLRKFIYADGGMTPEEMMMMQEQALPENMQGGGGDQMQEIIQSVAQMLQQGMDPQSVMEQLVQLGLPPEMAQQILQLVIEQIGGAQQMPQQGGGEEAMMQEEQQMVPEGQQPMMQPGGTFFNSMFYNVGPFVNKRTSTDYYKQGGSFSKRNFRVGDEIEVTVEELEELRKKGIKFDII